LGAEDGAERVPSGETVALDGSPIRQSDA